MKKITVAVVAILTFGLAQASSAAIFLGPSPYLSFRDSPFQGPGYNYFFLEDFEDGALNTPGVNANKGEVGGLNMYTDSVDGDDGVIDGNGNGGHSWALYNDTNDYVSFAFDKNVLGALPTHAGVVWTDVHPGTGYVTFSAFDAHGISLGSVTALLGEGSTLGDTGDDRFFGVVDQGGISEIIMSTTPGMTWEVDHLQYGSQVPVPAAVWLLGSGLAGLFGLRRRSAR